jgi:hypothetical protein
MRLEGLGKYKISTSLGLEAATFRLVAQCLNHYATDGVYNNLMNVALLSP